MKFIFTTLILFALSLPQVFSQSINGVPLKEIDTEYLRIVGYSKLMSNKVTIELDFGQRDKIWNSKDTRLVDENGKSIVLNSMVDALNFVSKSGYEFVQAYAFAVSNQSVYHYLMRKTSKEK